MDPHAAGNSFFPTLQSKQARKESHRRTGQRAHHSARCTSMHAYVWYSRSVAASARCPFVDPNELNLPFLRMKLEPVAELPLRGFVSGESTLEGYHDCAAVIFPPVRSVL